MLWCPSPQQKIHNELKTHTTMTKINMRKRVSSTTKKVTSRVMSGDPEEKTLTVMDTRRAEKATNGRRGKRVAGPATTRTMRVTRTNKPRRAMKLTTRPMKTTRRVIKTTKVTRKTIKPTKVTMRTTTPIKVTRRITRSTKVTRRITKPMMVTKRTTKLMKVTRRTTKPMRVAMRTTKVTRKPTRASKLTTLRRITRISTKASGPTERREANMVGAVMRNMEAMITIVSPVLIT